MPSAKSQDVRRRGPKLAIPLDADVSCVRYYKCGSAAEPKTTATAKAAKERPVEKTILRYIPPALRRPSPWSEFLTEWLTACEQQQPSQHDDTTDSCSVSSTSSGACSGGTVTTDFSSVSSPRNGLENRIIAPPAPVYAYTHPVPQQSQPTTPRYPYRVPPATRQDSQLTPAQWAELRMLQQHAQPSRAPPPPAKLMNIHTAYLPDLDAAVLQMMRLQPSRTQQQQRQAPPPVSQPWTPQFHGHYQPPKGNSSKGTASSISSGTTTISSTHGSEGRGRGKQAECVYCYQFAVNEAMARDGARLPHIQDKGFWRGHTLKEGNTIVCPRLIRRICPLCGATGQHAHATEYCPVTQRKTTRY